MRSLCCKAGIMRDHGLGSLGPSATDGLHSPLGPRLTQYASEATAACSHITLVGSMAGAISIIQSAVNLRLTKANVP
jgi:hypothetical protein